MKWERDIVRNRKQLDIAMEIANKRGITDE